LKTLFINGVIYTVTFNASIFTGVLAAIGMILHEFPEGVGASHLLPEVERENKRYGIPALAAGVLVAVGIVLSGG
jgi:zinc and cadmium transporter